MAPDSTPPSLPPRNPGIALPPFHRSDQDDIPLTLAQAARLLPSVRGDRPPHPSTLYRWGKNGLVSRSGNREHLKIFRVGGTNCTTLGALKRFFARLSDVEAVASPQSQNDDSALRSQAEQAMSILMPRWKT